MNNRRYIIPTAIKSQQQSPISPHIPQHESLLFPWSNPNLADSNQPHLPPYLRSVTRVFPASKTAADSCRVPLGFVISPAQVSDCPVFESVARCRRCGSCLCPQATVSECRCAWTCPLCGSANSGVFGRPPELRTIVYDVAEKEGREKCPTFCFLVDMSYEALAVGLTQQMLMSVRACLSSLRPESRVGLMTMSSIVTMFDLVNSVEVVVPDLTEFVCTLDRERLLPRMKDCREKLEDALDELMKRTVDTSTSGHCLASALLLLDQIMRETGGIVIASFVGLPKNGPYQLKERQSVGNEELPLLRLPEDGSGKIFRECAFKLNRESISVHMFTTGQKFADLSVVAIPSGFTCGECKHYNVFDEAARSKMHADIFRTLTNRYCWDACLKVRMSKGCRIVRPHGNCTIRNGNCIAFPIIASEDAVAFEVAVGEEGIQNGKRVVFQFEMKYANDEGKRMIRIFTIEIPVSNVIASICSSVDEAALAAMMCKRACTAVIQKGPIQGVEMIRREIQAMMSNSHFKFCSFYHLMHALLSNATFRSQHPFGVDGRMSQILMLRSLNITNILLYLYPRMFSVNTGNVLPLTSASFSQGTAFLFHTVDKIYIWVSAAANSSFLSNVFGCENMQNLPTAFPPPDTLKVNKDSIEFTKLENLIANCNKFSRKYLPVEVIGQENPREYIFSDIIIEDSTTSGSNLVMWTQSMRMFSQ